MSQMSAVFTTDTKF